MIPRKNIFLILNSKNSMQCLLVLEAAKFLYDELKEMILGYSSFYKNLKFLILKILRLEEKKIGEYGNNEIWKLAEKYLSNRQDFMLQKDLILIKWYNLKVNLVEKVNEERRE